MIVTPVDGHVHFHPCFALPDFLDWAITNFTDLAQFNGVQSSGVQSSGAQSNGSAGAPAPLSPSPCGVLLLTQIGESDPLQPLLDQAARHREWSQQRLDEHAVLFSGRDAKSVMLIAGRQIVTAEGLELLSLCSRSPLAARQPLEDSVAASIASGGIPVLPWGFGKWWFSRGRIARNFLASNKHSGVLIGDNGNRLRMMKGEINRCQRVHGSQILAGSDPLPLANQVTRVASFGTLLPGAIDLTAPTEWMRQSLRDSSTKWTTYGKCRRLGQFCNDQLTLRLEKMRHDSH